MVEDTKEETPFQSTLPARGATGIRNIDRRDRAISIHAPRTGSDVNVSYAVLMSVYISIHAPRTGSDLNTDAIQQRREISIHAPRTGSDCAK